MTIVVAEKRCPDCGEVKPLDEFHRNKSTKDGRLHYCKPCQRARTRAYQERRRAEIGDEAFRTEQRAAIARHRAKTGNAHGKAYSRAVNQATKALKEAHPKEYAELLRRALYEQGRAS